MATTNGERWGRTPHWIGVLRQEERKKKGFGVLYCI
jgi:hypothetical protein